MIESFYSNLLVLPQKYSRYAFIMLCFSQVCLINSGNSLPLGAVLPNGWLVDQLNLQANGLHGNEYDFYNWLVPKFAFPSCPSLWLRGTRVTSGWLTENGPVDHRLILISTKVPFAKHKSWYKVLICGGSEGPSYWFNGNVGAAFLLNDSRLKGQVQAFLDYVLNNQASDGWLGPEPRTLWGRCVYSS